MTKPRGREKVGCKGEDAVREIMTHICADRPNARTNGVVVGSTGENAKFIAEDALNTEQPHFEELSMTEFKRVCE